MSSSFFSDTTKKAVTYFCHSFLVGAGGFASRGLKNSPQDCFLPSADGRPVRILPAPAQKRTRNLSCGSFLSECDKRDTLFFYSFGFRILDTSVTCRFSFFIQPFDFLLLLWNFNFLKFMCHWFLPQKPICNVMYILYYLQHAFLHSIIFFSIRTIGNKL